ncbi:MAG: hypothetical protein JJT78_08295, partial [Leptospira sp.]|nr:hypothetical protein [Leptospira sp.]
MQIELNNAEKRIIDNSMEPIEEKLNTLLDKEAILLEALEDNIVSSILTYTSLDEILLPFGGLFVKNQSIRREISMLRNEIDCCLSQMYNLYIIIGVKVNQNNLLLFS